LLSPAATSCPCIFLSEDRSWGRGTQESRGVGLICYISELFSSFFPKEQSQNMLIDILQVLFSLDISDE
jgi:hypothetical protein